MKRRTCSFMVLALGGAALLFGGQTVFAVQRAPTATGKAATATPLRFESRHEGRFGGTRMRYLARVAESFLSDDSGNHTASLVSVSYIREDVPKGANRPVVFVFNGGPGSSSLWLHMGLVGPRRVDFRDDIHPETAPPFRLVDNHDSILDVADVVLYDPPGTGFSRIIGKGEPKEFYGVKQDALATVRFIRQWISQNDRWNSPRFLMGESYGTIRAAVVARLLAGGPMATGGMEGLTLNGVILLGQAMDWNFGEESFANNLPTLAATAWYHGKRRSPDETLEQRVHEAQDFAAGAYLTALYAGDRLDPATRAAIAQRLADLTGLSVEFVTAHKLRISNGDFARELLRTKGLEVGRYDARYTLPLAASAGDPVADDPAMGQYVPGFIAALNMYMRDELGVTIDEPYQAIDFRKVNRVWDYGLGPGVPAHSNYGEDLATAMRRNPQLHLFIGCGYYDLTTTLGAAAYTAAHSGFPLERVVMKTYESGHMPYLGGDSRSRLATDLRAFIRQASSP